MSSRSCKNTEGTIFPFQVESLEDGVDDAVHGLHPRAFYTIDVTSPKEYCKE